MSLLPARTINQTILILASRQKLNTSIKEEAVTSIKVKRRSWISSGTSQSPQSFE